MGKHVILLNPSVLPRNGAVLGQPCFISGDVIQFIIPAQSTKLLDVVLAGKFCLLNPDQSGAGGSPSLYLAEGPKIFGFNGKVGKLGLFSYLRLSRAYTGNVIESWPQLPLQLSFIGSTQHGSGFASYNAGTGLQPWRIDTAYGASRGLCLPSVTATNPVIPLTLQVEDFYYSPPCGLLSDRQAKSLTALNGLQFDMQVANIGDAMQAVLPFKTTAGTKSNLSAYGMPRQYVGAAYSETTNLPSFVGILNPVMYYIIDDSDTIPSSQQVTYVSVDLVRTQLIPSFSQFVSWPIARLLLKSVLVFVMNKNSQSSVELGALLTCSFRTYDVQLLLNGARQIFAYNTARGAVGYDWSENTPNAFLVNLRSEPRRFYASQRVCRGAFTIWDYDIIGTGSLISGVNVVCNLTLQVWPQTLLGTPYNPLDGTTCLSLQPEKEQSFGLFRVIRPQTNNAQVQTFQGLGYTSVHDYSISTGIGTALPLTSGFPTVYPVSTALNYLQKYNVFSQPSTDYQFVTTTLSSKTLIVNNEASVIVPEAQGSIRQKYNPYLNLNHAAPQSSVVRVQELTLSTEIIASSIPNTIGIRILLPDNGVLGKMYLNLPIRATNAAGLSLWGNVVVNNPGPGATFDATFIYASAASNGFQPSNLLLNNGYTHSGLVANSLCFDMTVADYFQSQVAAPEPPATSIGYETIAFNRFGYSSVLGTVSFIKGLQWVLPENLAIQRYELQAETFLHRYDEANDVDFIHTRYTSRQSNAFFPSDLHSGALVDCIWARLYNHAYSCIDSVFPIYHNTNRVLSDMPLAATQQLRIDIGTLDQTCKAMEGSLLCSSQKRYLDIFVDQKLIGLANHPCGYGGSKFVGAELNSFTGAGVEPKTLSSVAFASQFGIELIPGTQPTVTIQLIYHDTASMQRLNETFKARGYQFTVADFSFQRKFYGVGALATIATPLGDRIDLPIGGKNPACCIITHKPLTWVNNELNLNITPQATTCQSGIPPYIYCRDGAFGLSIPAQITDPSLWITAPVVTYTPQIDNTLIYTFPFGTSVTNAIGYALVHNKPLSLTQHLVDFGCKRASPVMESMFYTTSLRGSAAASVLGIVAPLVSALRGVNNSAAYSVLPGPKTRSCYHGAPLLPSRFVTTIPILPDMQNGNLLSIYSSPSTYQVPSILGVNPPTAGDLAASNAGLYPAGTLTTMHGGSLIQYMMREFAFPQSYTVWYNHNAATITYNYPTGQVVQ